MNKQSFSFIVFAMIQLFCGFSLFAVEMYGTRGVNGVTVITSKLSNVECPDPDNA
jgi:hypothetical protein